MEMAMAEAGDLVDFVMTDQGSLEDWFHAERLMEFQFRACHQELLEHAGDIHALFVRLLKEQSGIGAGFRAFLIPLMVTAIIRSFDTGVGLATRCRSSEVYPFKRQIVEAVCHLGIVTMEDAAAEIWYKEHQTKWGERPSEPWKKVFGHHKNRGLSDGRREYFKKLFNQTSNSTHISMFRVPKAQEFDHETRELKSWLLDVEQSFNVMVMLGLLDLGVKALAEVSFGLERLRGRPGLSMAIATLQSQHVLLLSKHGFEIGMAGEPVLRGFGVSGEELGGR